MARMNSLKETIDKFKKIEMAISIGVGVIFLIGLGLTIALITGAKFTLNTNNMVQPWIGDFLWGGTIIVLIGVVVYAIIDVQLHSKTKKYNGMVDDYNNGTLPDDSENEELDDNEEDYDNEFDDEEETIVDEASNDKENVTAKNQAPIINTNSGIQFEYYKGNHEMVLMSVKKIKL